MAAQWEDPEKLRKLARVTLGYEEEDEEDDGDSDSDEKRIPEFYIPLLVQYVQTNPYDTNFIVEFAEKGKPSRGGNGFGAITCMEGYCWRDINLDADPERPEGGRREGFGSFFNYQQHCLEDAGHAKGRNERLKKKGIQPPPIATLGGPSTSFGSRPQPIRPSASSLPLSPVDTNRERPLVKAERGPDAKPVLSGSDACRSASAGMSSDPIYVSDEEAGSDDDEAGVQALDASQIPEAMRKRTNRDNPFVLSDDEDPPSSSARQSARSAVAPHPFFTLSQENAIAGPSSAASTSAPILASVSAPGRSILPEVEALLRVGLQLPSTLAADRSEVPQTWYDNEVRHSVNASGAVQPKFATNSSLPRLSDAVRDSPRAELQFVYERSLMVRLQRHHKHNYVLLAPITAHGAMLGNASDIGLPKTQEYTSPSLQVLFCGGTLLRELWEKHVPKAPRSGVNFTFGASNTYADRKPYPHPIISDPSSRRGPNQLLSALDRKPDINSIPDWQANAAAGPSSQAGSSGRFSDALARLYGLASDSIGRLGLGLGDLPLARPPHALLDVDEHDFGYEWDRPVSAEGFADLFKTALDDFFEDTSVDDALKELDLTKIDDRIPNLSVTLMPHQIIGVAWMVKQEKKTSCAGGILADAMGLGKTIQTIATMVKNPSTDRKIKNTLIILPLPLLQQWKEEIESKSNLSVYIYHGPKRTKSMNQLKAVDVVLTTYSIVANEASAMIEPPKRRKKKNDFVDDDEEDEKPRIKQKGLLFKVHWYRCVLDEAAIIRNKATKSHKACMLLDAEIKWCLSGTLIYNNLTDTFAYLRFVGIISWEDFRERIHLIANRKPRLASKRVQAVLRKTMLRRTKDSTLNGKKILQLPPKTIEMVEMEFTEEERAIYAQIEADARVKVNKFFKAGTLLKNYSVVLVLLTRLRQLCCHPWLLRSSDEYQDANAVVCVEVDDEDAVAHGGAPSKTLTDEEELARAEQEQGAAWVDKIRKSLEDRYVSMTEDKDYGEAEVEEDAFSCPICFEPLANERVTACGHSFCHECIEGILTAPMRGDMDEAQDALFARHARPCPLCRSEVSRQTLYRASAFFDPTDYDDVDEDSQAEEDEDADALDDMDEYDELEDEEDIKPDVSGKGKRRALGERSIGAKRRRLSKGKGKAAAKIEPKEEVLDGLGEVDIEDVEPSTKMQRIGAVLENLRAIDPTQKTLIFSSFVELLQLVGVYLRKRNVKYLLYTGQMPMSEREANIKAFSAEGGPEVLLMSLKAGAVGLNLTAASNVIMLDLAWSPATEAQAIDRSHRIGQSRPVTVKRLVIRDSVEQRILALQEKKQMLMDGAMGEGDGGRLPRLSARELLDLFGRDDGHD